MPGPAVGHEPPPDLSANPLPDFYSQPIGPFTMYMTVLATGPSQYGLFTAPGCVADSIFKRGMKLVWRFEVYDIANGKRLTDRDGSRVSITLPDGTTEQARFEPRGPAGQVAPDAPWTWVAVWNIPLDYPLGPVDYRVDVGTADGRAGSIQPATFVGNYLQVVQ